MEYDEYQRGKDTGEGKLVAFKLKEDQVMLLNEMTEAFPTYMTRSDVIRAMVMPYCKALELAKEGQQWRGAMEFGKGLVRLKKFLEEAENEANQQSLEPELFAEGSVLQVPNAS